MLPTSRRWTKPTLQRDTEKKQKSNSYWQEQDSPTAGKKSLPPATLKLGVLFWLTFSVGLVHGGICPRQEHHGRSAWWKKVIYPTEARWKDRSEGLGTGIQPSR